MLPVGVDCVSLPIALLEAAMVTCHHACSPYLLRSNQGPLIQVPVSGTVATLEPHTAPLSPTSSPQLRPDQAEQGFPRTTAPGMLLSTLNTVCFFTANLRGPVYLTLKIKKLSLREKYTIA